MIAWRPVVTEMLEAIRHKHDLFKGVFINIVGPDTLDLPKEINDKTVISHEGTIGDFEFPTLEKIENFCKDHLDVKVCYIHTKSVSSEIGTVRRKRCEDWCRLMILFNIELAEKRIEDLDSGFDASGVNFRKTPSPHFSGNFWWAKSDYIRKLPLINQVKNKVYANQKRHSAEFWVGLGNGKLTSDYNSGSLYLMDIDINKIREKYLSINS